MKSLPLSFLTTLSLGLVLAVVAIGILLPQPATAQVVGIPCGNEVEEVSDSQGRVIGTRVSNPCGFDDLVLLANNVTTFLILITIPLAAILFAYAGFLMVTAGGDQGQIGKAKRIFINVGIGFLLVLSAWLIVYTITEALVKEEIRESPGFLLQ